MNQNNRIVLSKEEFFIVTKILEAHLPKNAEIWVFGSRTKNTDKKTADLDLAIDLGRPVNKRELLGLELAFEESNLSFPVDIVDMQSVSDTFKNIVLEERVIFCEKSL
jgi:predicted nucleotidyltransferase